MDLKSLLKFSTFHRFYAKKLPPLVTNWPAAGPPQCGESVDALQNQTEVGKDGCFTRARNLVGGRRPMCSHATTSQITTQSRIPPICTKAIFCKIDEWTHSKPNGWAV